MPLAAAFVVAILLLCHAAPLVLSSKLITPPPGNSIALRAITLNGELGYTCGKDGGNWPLVQTRATLLDPTNQTKVIGFYSRNFRRLSSIRHVGTWTLNNSEGDVAESGHAYSLVSGKLLVTFNSQKGVLPNFLAQASLHRYEGAAQTISYISQTNATLLQAPLFPICDAKKHTISIKFMAEYTFWRQDLLPPRVPHSLSLPTQHHVVESFFAQGVVRFNYDHKLQLWRQHRILAKLYDVPGGILLGSFIYNSSSTNSQTTSISFKTDSSSLACILVNNPNGFTICGRQAAMDSSEAHNPSLPWSLFDVTSNKGYITNILGPFSAFQMVSTWGGLLPQNLNGSNVTNSLHAWKSFFTTIFWLYTRRGT